MNYTVSVRLMTFNHGEFIRQAMEGIMMQKTNFNVEVVIGDDFSKDNTLEIVNSFRDSDKVHLKVLNRSVGDAYWTERQKRGRLYNFANIVENCSGKYIALLDGDDYWTDPFKLQRQVDFMETHVDYSICFHRVQMKLGENLNPFPKDDFLKDTFYTEDLFEDWFVPSCSVLFRRQSDFKFPDWFYYSSHGDLSLLLLSSMSGKIKYLNESMGVYRRHEGGLSNHLSTIGMIGTLSYVYTNVIRDSNFKLINTAKDSLVRLANAQVEKAVKRRTVNLAAEIVRDINFISEKVSLKDLLRAIYLKYKRKWSKA